MSETVSEPSTRERILEAANGLLAAKGETFSMEELAEAAGVSRQTIYLQFKTRPILFLELTFHRMGQDPDLRAMAAALDQSPIGAFERFFRHWMRLAMKVERSFRVYWIGAENDPELMARTREADTTFSHRFLGLFEKLAEAGVLRDIWSPQEAADAAYQTTMYGVFSGHLRNMRGWSPKEIEERGMRVLRATFLTDEAAKKAEKIKVPRAT